MTAGQHHPAIPEEEMDVGVGDDATSILIDLTDGADLMARVAVEGRREVPFVDLTAGYRRLRQEIDDAIAQVLVKGDFVLGGAVTSFERAFAEYCGVGHAIGVDSGFSALELILRAYDIGPGDEVVTAANTFVATVAAIEATGARAVLVDIDPTTYNLDPEQVVKALSPSTKAILPVHLYGQPADMATITAIAIERGVAVFEDACQAHGARLGGRRAGSLGDAAAFSFYPSKNLGALGDGGMVVTDDPDLADRVRMLRNLGSVAKYHHEIKGFNRRLDTLHAAVLNVKLDHLDGDNQARRRAAGLYGELLADLPLELPTVVEGADHVFHLYVVRVDDREALRSHLLDLGVSTGVHYPVPVHLQQGYSSLGYGSGDFPITEMAAARILSLPMYPDMDLESIAHVAGAIRSFYER